MDQQTIVTSASDTALAPLVEEAAHLLRHADAEIQRLKSALHLVGAEIMHGVEAIAAGDVTTGMNSLVEAEAIARHYAGEAFSGGLPPNVVRIDDLRFRRNAANLVSL